MPLLAIFTRDGDKLITDMTTVHGKESALRKQLSVIHKRLGIDSDVVPSANGEELNYRHVITNKQLGKLPNFLRMINKQEGFYELHVASEFPFMRACTYIDEIVEGDVTLSPADTNCMGVLKYDRPVRSSIR